MNSIERYNTTDHGAAIEKVIAGGDLSGLKPHERIRFYEQTCKSLGVNPFTRPLVYIKLNGSLTLYASSRCTQQIAMARGISFDVSDPKIENGLITCHVVAKDPQGRSDSDIGAIECPAGIKPYELANLMKKVVTQAKRRVILSMFGLGWASGEEQRDSGDPEPEEPQYVNAEPEEIEPIPLSMTSEEMREHILKAADSAGIPSDVLRSNLKDRWGIRYPSDLDSQKYNEILSWISQSEVHGGIRPHG